MLQDPLIQEFQIHSPHIRLLFAQRRPTGNWKFSNLKAPYWRLYHHSVHGAWIQLNTHKIQLDPAYLYLIPPDVSFSSGNDHELLQFFVHFVIEPQVSARRLKQKVYEIPLSQGLSENLQQVIKSQNLSRQSLLLNALVQQTLAHSELNLRGRSLSTRLEEAKTFMRQHMKDGVSNPEVGEKLGMTPNAFIRWFKQSTGLTPQSWLNRERVHEASYWLHHNDASIERIAETLGFCDRYHFSRVFKQIQGTSPVRFRKNRNLSEGKLKV